MKLYGTDASPFVARVRIQVYRKKLPVDIVPPPGGLGSEEYLQITPVGKIPALDLGLDTTPFTRFTAWADNVKHDVDVSRVLAEMETAIQARQVYGWQLY